MSGGGRSYSERAVWRRQLSALRRIAGSGPHHVFAKASASPALRVLAPQNRKKEVAHLRLMRPVSCIGFHHRTVFMSDPSAAKSVPYPTQFRDLSEEQVQSLKSTIKLCRLRLAGALADLRQAKSKPVGRVGAHFKIMGTSRDDLRDLSIIENNLNRMVGVLLGFENMVLDGERTGPAMGLGRLVGVDVEAYVRSTTPPKAGEEGVIKIVTEPFFKRNDEERGSMLIHEIGHRFVGLKDVKYVQGRAVRISREDAMRNADSYAAFVFP
ncbi:MAG: hypothetical protein AAFW98_12540, partial [Pseudomonadota bacterium]